MNRPHEKKDKTRTLLWMLSGIGLILVGALRMHDGSFTDAFFLDLIGGILIFFNHTRFLNLFTKKPQNAELAGRTAYTEPHAAKQYRADIKQFRQQKRLWLTLAVLLFLLICSCACGYFAIADQYSSAWPYGYALILAVGCILIILGLNVLTVKATQRFEFAAEHEAKAEECLLSAMAYAARAQELPDIGGRLIDVRYLDDYIRRLLIIVDPFDRSADVLNDPSIPFVFCIYAVQIFDIKSHRWLTDTVYSFDSLEEMLAEIAFHFDGLFISTPHTPTPSLQNRCGRSCSGRWARHRPR